MNEGFKKHVEVEEEVVVQAKERADIKLRQDFADEKEKNRILKIKEERNELTQELLEKYPDDLQLNRYSYYKNRVYQTIGVERDDRGYSKVGSEWKGQSAEENFLNKVQIKDDQRVLVLGDVESFRGKDEKERLIIFKDLIQYYSDDEFQKDELCDLGRYSENKLKNEIEKFNSEIKIEKINFYTGVGTTLDYNFGVDSWIEITDEDGLSVPIYYDMKSNIKKDVSDIALVKKIQKNEDGISGGYADLGLHVYEEDGDVPLKENLNITLVDGFLSRIKNIYFAKRSKSLNNENTIIYPKDN